MTRLSLGVQSLDDAVLRRLGRTHSAADARAAYGAARAAGFDDVNVDLLFACPGEDLAGFTRTLDEVLAWAPDHLSAYALTLEPATPFGRRPPAGLPDEDLQVAQFETLVERTRHAGLERYEVSNFARPGRRSRHNLGYWRREDYSGSARALTARSGRSATRPSAPSPAGGPPSSRGTGRSRAGSG